MKKAVFFLISLVFTLTIFSLSQVPFAHSGPMLKMVSIKANAPGQLKKLVRVGIDISEVVKEPVVEGPRGVPLQTYRVEAVISAFDEKKLGEEGFNWSDVPGRGRSKRSVMNMMFTRVLMRPKTASKLSSTKSRPPIPKYANSKPSVTPFRTGNCLLCD
jgi:hypothetical protein